MEGATHRALWSPRGVDLHILCILYCILCTMLGPCCSIPYYHMLYYIPVGKKLTHLLWVPSTSACCPGVLVSESRHACAFASCVFLDGRNDGAEGHVL